MTGDRKHHWDEVYATRGEDRLSWHQDDPAISLDLAGRAGLAPDWAVIDIGGGASRFAEALLGRGVTDVTVLDLSAVALDKARQRLGVAGEAVRWVAADVTRWIPQRAYDLWHDRAVFHFLVEEEGRAAYLDRLARCLAPGGHAIIATFDLDGPEKCSGLPVVRYSPETLTRTLGGGYELVAERRERHLTPWGSPQAFQFSLFRKAG